MMKNFVFLSIICIVTSQKSPTVKTRAGAIRGVNEDGVIKFLGIPYAMVNRTNRFGISTPYQFKAEFNATEYKSKDVCDKDQNNITNSYDCLYLNIYKPAFNRKLLPIVIYMYSEKNHEKLLHSTRSLLKGNNIVVKMYYRSGIHGFMCLNSPLVPGNQGIKDMELGLKWIEENIKDFGGNPNKITIFNEDMDIDLSIVYEKTEIKNKTNVPIFEFESFVVHSNDVQKPDDSVPKLLSMELGCESNDTADALMFLSTIDEKYLNKVSKKLNISYKVCTEDGVVFENDPYDDINMFCNAFDGMLQGVSTILALIGLN